MGKYKQIPQITNKREVQRFHIQTCVEHFIENMIRDIGLDPYYYWSNTLKFDNEWDKDIIAEVVIEEFQQVESNGQITFNLDGKVLSAEYRPRWN